MTYYDRKEPFIIGIDFDGTITPTPRGSENYPEPTEEFQEFYIWLNDYNCKEAVKDEESCPMYLCIHTARDLSDDKHYIYILRYLREYGFGQIYMPRRKGIKMVDLMNDKLYLPYRVNRNSKLPCSVFIDDANIGTPKHLDGSINWKKVKKLLLKEVKAVKKYWRKHDEE